MPINNTVDVKNDGAIIIADVMLVITAFNTVNGDGKYIQRYDLNNDGSVNIADVMMIAAKFNTLVK